MPAIEEGYQFVGNQIVYFNSRPLTDSIEYTTWSRVVVDLTYDSTLFALNVYSTATGYQVYQSEFGNYAATQRIVPTVKPAFI